MNNSTAEPASSEPESETDGRGSRGTMKTTPAVLLGVLERYGLVLLLLALIALFATVAAGAALFRSTANIDLLLSNQSITGVIALGMVVPLIAGYFDLSVAAVAGVANVAMASAMSKYGVPVIPALIGTCALGAAIGVASGFLVAKLRLNAFIVTLGAYTLLLGVIQWYTNGQVISQGIPESLTGWISDKTLGLPRSFIVLICIATVVWYFVVHTPRGRFLEAIGSNESAARLVGIGVDRSVWLAFVVSGFLGGLAGVLLTARQGNADPTAAPAYLFPALTGVFLGATVIKPGRYNVWGTVIGIFFVAVSVSGLTFMGADTWVQNLFNGAALIVAVALSTFMARAAERASPRRRAAREGEPSG